LIFVPKALSGEFMYQAQSPFGQMQWLNKWLVQGQVFPQPMLIRPFFRPRRFVQALPVIIPSTVEFDFSIPQAVWTINHNLGQFPSVTLVDTTGAVVLADILYVNNNQIIVTFSQPFAGKAYLNF
jgi:hypothetical protein